MQVKSKEKFSHEDFIDNAFSGDFFIQFFTIVKVIPLITDVSQTLVVCIKTVNEIEIWTFRFIPVAPNLTSAGVSGLWVLKVLETIQDD